MKILHIFPSRPDDPIRQAVSAMMPIAPTVLASLTPPEHEFKAIDMLHGDKVDFDEPADLVGITVRTPMAELAYEIAREFMKRGAKVVIGGPHTHALPEESAKHASSVAIGEVDDLWGTIIKDASQGSLKKYYIQGDRKVNADEADIHRSDGFASLDDKPIPDRNCYVSKGGYMVDTIQTTRGCPYSCTFCSVPRLFGRTQRHRPLDDVIKEIAGMKEIFCNFDDCVFGHDGKDPYYADLFKEIAGLKGRRRWVGQGYPNVTTSKEGLKTLQLAADAGLWSLSVGVEAITSEGQAQAKSFKKLGFQSAQDFNLEDLKERLLIIKDHGVDLMLWIVMGWDGDTLDTYKAASDFCDEIETAGLIINLMPIPGTAIYEDFQKQGRLEKDFSFEAYMRGGNSGFKHPTMDYAKMREHARAAMERLFTQDKIEARADAIGKKRGEPFLKMASMVAQTSMKKAFTL